MSPESLGLNWTRLKVCKSEASGDRRSTSLVTNRRNITNGKITTCALVTYYQFLISGSATKISFLFTSITVKTQKPIDKDTINVWVQVKRKCTKKYK